MRMLSAGSRSNRKPIFAMMAHAPAKLAMTDFENGHARGSPEKSVMAHAKYGLWRYRSASRYISPKGCNTKDML